MILKTNVPPPRPVPFTKRYFVSPNTDPNLAITSGIAPKPIQKIQPSEGLLNTPFYIWLNGSSELAIVTECILAISASILYITPNATVEPGIVTLQMEITNDLTPVPISASVYNYLSSNVPEKYTQNVSSVFHCLPGDLITIKIGYESAILVNPPTISLVPYDNTAPWNSLITVSHIQT